MEIMGLPNDGRSLSINSHFSLNRLNNRTFGAEVTDIAFLKAAPAMSSII